MADDADSMALAMPLFFSGPERAPLDGGVTVHVIVQAEAIGPGRELAGAMRVEAPDGSFHRKNGREFVAFAERNPWVKCWRLEGEDDERDD